MKGGRREVEPVHWGQDSGRRERSWLLQEKEHIKQENGGEGVSGGKDMREGVLKLVGAYFLFSHSVLTFHTTKS